MADQAGHGVDLRPGGLHGLGEDDPVDPLGAGRRGERAVQPQVRQPARQQHPGAQGLVQHAPLPFGQGLARERGQRRIGMPWREHRGQHRQGAVVGLVHQLRFQRVVPPLEGVLAGGTEDDVLQRVVMPVDPDRVLGFERYGADAAPVVEDLVADGVKGHTHGAAARARGGLAQIHR